MKIAIVTGASSGMGREAVIQLADRFGGGLGEIWAVARRADRLEELRSQVPVPLRILPLDLQKPDALEQLGWQLKQQKPDVKILVNARDMERQEPSAPLQEKRKPVWFG